MVKDGKDSSRLGMSSVGMWRVPPQGTRVSSQEVCKKLPATGIYS